MIGFNAWCDKNKGILSGCPGANRAAYLKDGHTDEYKKACFALSGPHGPTHKCVELGCNEWTKQRYNYDPCIGCNKK